MSTRRSKNLIALDKKIEEQHAIVKNAQAKLSTLMELRTDFEKSEAKIEAGKK